VKPYGPDVTSWSLVYTPFAGFERLIVAEYGVRTGGTIGNTAFVGPGAVPDRMLRSP
jgi:hypothetical protein